MMEDIEFEHVLEQLEGDVVRGDVQRAYVRAITYLRKVYGPVPCPQIRALIDDIFSTARQTGVIHSENIRSMILAWRPTI